ncbi:DinB family protein [Aestuariimicrobium soli]|uniref:DinB family protein n=1 Tax=Aestuariimicrobium soli TaxID=2035834 RepID=UPI003EB6DEBC
MTTFRDDDFSGAVFRECDLSRATLVGVVMQDASIDGLVTNLVVNGVEVMGFVERELDRRDPTRLLVRSPDPDDLRAAWAELASRWAATVERLRRTPGLEQRSVNDEWTPVQTLRHLVFVHDSWFRRCCLGSSEPFSELGLSAAFAPSPSPAEQPWRLDDVLAVRAEQTDELAAWLATVSADDLTAEAPVPLDEGWPAHSRGRSVRECLAVVLDETLLHHGFCVRDLDLLEAPSDG